MRKTILYLFIILFVIGIAAMITVPGHMTFNKYLIKKGRAMNVCKETRHTSYKFITVNYVEYCGPHPHIDKYIGAFGTFFKVKSDE